MTNSGTDAVEQVRVKVQPLTREGMKPYGEHGAMVLNEACTFVNITSSSYVAQTHVSTVETSIHRT